jgi:predicted Zn-ribbon and HTH transcriptional regulator
MDSITTRELWLVQASDILLDELIMPKTTAARPPVRVSVGWPAGSAKAIGQCWARANSSSGHNELFITPAISDSMLVLQTLVHELIHAVDDCQSGHKGPFAALARAVGLEGPLTATKAGPGLAEFLGVVHKELGDIPHATLETSNRKKQSTRMLKAECSSCEFSFRASKTQLDKMPTPALCPVCEERALAVATPEE